MNRRRRRTGVDRGNDRADTMGTNVYSSKDNQSLHKSLNGEFILYQILLQRLLDENEELPLSARQGLIKYFEPEDRNDEKVMKEFDEEYQREKSIHWYTRETCIYRILNKSLRTQNIDDVTPFGQFIRDLRQQLIEEKKSFIQQQKSSILIVYRGQLISKDEVNRLKSSTGELISMNSFLSTSTNKDKALEFARSRKPPTDELTNILLEMFVNIRSPSRPFADIKHLSAFAEEEEILFMFGCIFRLDQVYFDEENQLWRAKLTLCGDNDEDMIKFQSTLFGEIEGRNPLVAIGKYFVQMQKYEDAEDHYLKLIDEQILKSDLDLADCFLGLARVRNLKANYRLAIENLDEALSLLKKNEDEHQQLISECYNELGSIYRNEKNYSLAFQSYENALKVKFDDRSTTYLGICQIHSSMNNYQLALDNLEKALEYLDEKDFSNRSNLFIEKGKIYILINEKDLATKCFDKSIEIQKKFLGDRHPDLGYTYSALASLFSSIGEFSRAHEFISKSHQIQLETLPGNHQDFGQTFEDLANLYFEEKDFDQSLNYYQQSIDNRLKSLLWCHPLLVKLYSKMGQIHWQRKQFDQAELFFIKVLDAQLETKSSGDSSLTDAYRQLADFYLDKGDREQSIEFYLKTLKNALEMKLNEDFSLVDLYQILSKLFYEKRSLNDSLFYTNRLLDCFLRKEPLQQEKIDEIYQFIGKIYLKKKKFDESFLIYRDNQQQSDDPTMNNEESIQRRDFYRHTDDIHFERRHLDQADKYFRRFLRQQIKEKEKDKERNVSLLADLNQILGNISFEKNLFDEWLSYYLELIEWKRKICREDHHSFMEIYRSIGNVYLKKNFYSKSLFYFHRLIDCQNKYSNRFKRKSFDETFYSIGSIFIQKYFQKKFSQRIFSLNEQNRHSSSIQFELFHLNNDLNYFQNLAEKQRSRENGSTKRKSSTKKFFSLEQIYLVLSSLFWEKNSFSSSIFYLHQTLDLQLKRKVPNEDLIPFTYFALADLYQKQSIQSTSIDYFRSALNILEEKQRRQQQRQRRETNRSSLDEDQQQFIELINLRIREVFIPNLHF